jgi:hypothetical protein
MKILLAILFTSITASAQTHIKAGTVDATTVNATATNSTTVNSSNVNTTLNALLFSGADIGAQINIAAATCSSSSQCKIIIPSTLQLSFSTPIVYVQNETIECVRNGAVANGNGLEGLTTLNYTGSGTAVTMGVSNGRFIGCDLLLGSTATNGIFIGSSSVSVYSNHVEDASIRNGGTGTTLIKISCAGGGACEDENIINSRLSNFTGVGVSIDNSNDTHLYNNTVYAKAAGNTTSISLLIDSGAGGVNVSGFIGGSSGLHGMVVRHTLAGGFPVWGFIWNFQCDLPSSDCFLFDSTLNSAIIGYTLVNPWAAGSTGGAGINIQGGGNINIQGALIRNNANDGVLINTGGAGAPGSIFISNSIIQGNNQSNAGFNGISIHGHPNLITITGNHINNSPEVGGNQQYALQAYSDIDSLNFSNNDCANNVTGCSLTTLVTGSKLNLVGNIAQAALSVPSYVAGNFQTGGGYSSGAASSFFAQGSTAMPTGALGANACSSAITVATTGVTTSMRVQWNLHTTPVGVNGYGNSPVTIFAWLTSGNVNFIQCATTAVTPGAMSVDWTVF